MILNSSLLKTKFLIYAFNGRTKNTPVLSWALTKPFYMSSGYKETWEGRYSEGTIGLKAHSTSFRAFKIAAEYTPAAGTPSSWRWFLPSYSDWKAAFGMLGFGDTSQVKDANQRYSWNGSIVDKLFKQAGGKTILNKHYWTSTEYQTTEAGTVNPTADGMAWYSQIKGARTHVRPFIKF